MNRQELQDLVDLPEAEAVRVHFDRSNLRLIARMAVLFALISLGSLFALLAQERREPLLAWICAANVVAGLALFISRRRPDLPGAVGRWLLLWVALQLAVLLAPTSEEGGVIMLAGVLFPALLVGLRLRSGEVAFLAALLPAATWFVLARLTSSAQGNGPGGPTVAVAFLAATAAGLAIWRTRAARRRFLGEWTSAVAESRERLRLRSELAFAREIQLGMLPAGPPDLGWIDVAASCEPAAEVGGDYYDWFVLSPSRVALVVGDVAGHGVASGLVLAGVRSCLYLLRRDLVAPGGVVARLDEVVRDVGARRMFMALLVVVLDAERAEARIVCAGHPPALRRPAAGGGVESLGIPSPPLGTRLGARFAEQVVPLAPGDLWLLHSDGVVESRADGGELFGDARVAARLAELAPGTAGELCAGLVESLRAFRGGRPAEDDCTLLVARVGDLGSTSPHGSSAEAS